MVQELARVPLFERLSAPEIEKLEARAARKRFPSGTAIFFQDDPSDSLYVVLSGSAKVFRTSEDGRDRILMILRPGDAVGELAMIEGLPRTATVQTLEDTEMLTLTRKDFEAFAHEHPEFLWKLLQAMAERVRKINEDVLDLSFKDVPYRVLRLLSQLVSRHGESGPEGWRIKMPLSVRDLSSMVGSNTETVGRLLDRYESDGLVRRQGPNWVIPDQGALTRALEYAAAE
ncbi:MAG TPA: Crp/Fnr family transcriptional regulator [Vicinamibacteria bacterium]|nr:Crp/Fnr family transcriptional regulator [Vicinamibacteria bacterium]